MAGLYVDTSALGRVLLGEPDAATIRATLGSYAPWWSSELLLVELRRLGARQGLLADAELLLSGVRLRPVDRAVLDAAARVEPMTVRSLDAIHLQAGVELAASGDVEAVLTYDLQLQAGCAHHGLRVEAPTH